MRCSSARRSAAHEVPHDRRHDDHEEHQAARGDPGEAAPQLAGAVADRVVGGVDLEQRHLAAGGPDRAVDLDQPVVALERVLGRVRSDTSATVAGWAQGLALVVAQREGAPDELALVGVEHLARRSLHSLTRTIESLSSWSRATSSKAAMAAGSPATSAVGERRLDDRLGQHARHRRGVVDRLALGELPGRERADHADDEQRGHDPQREQHQHPARAEQRLGGARAARVAQGHPRRGRLGRSSGSRRRRPRWCHGVGLPSSSSASTETSPAAAGAAGDCSGEPAQSSDPWPPESSPPRVVRAVARAVVAGVVASRGGRCRQPWCRRPGPSCRRPRVVGAARRGRRRPWSSEPWPEWLRAGPGVVVTPVRGRSPPWSSPGSSSEVPGGRLPPWSSPGSDSVGLGRRGRALGALDEAELVGECSGSRWANEALPNRPTAAGTATTTPATRAMRRRRMRVSFREAVCQKGQAGRTSRCRAGLAGCRCAWRVRRAPQGLRSAARGDGCGGGC